MADAMLLRPVLPESSALPPSVSLVTICKNAASTIVRTLASVAECRYPRLQYVIVDGGSTDGTCEKIRRFGPRVDKFVSESDAGISDALNKAVALSDGDYHLIVHADDALLPEALPSLVRDSKNGEAMVVCGRVNVVGSRGVVRDFVPEPEKLREKMSIPHMGSLIRKEAWAAVGGYDVRRRIAMDHLLMLRILGKYGIDAFSVSDVSVANYHLGGVSDRMVDLGFREVRDNLLEEGVGKWRANAAYLRLRAKARLARALGRK